jgi:endonuclease/exonuclease/phosphatase family metal-dependent hydrolase
MRRGRSTRFRSWGLVALAVVVATFAIGVQSVAWAGNGRLHMTAMTYNLFQGSELSDAIRATPSTVLGAVAQDYNEVVTTNFSERADAIAAEVQSAGPDLIGLQEAALWKTGEPVASYPPPPPTTVSYDFVAVLVQALNARGLHYAPVAITDNFSVAAPGLFPTGLFMSVQLTDRVAILARTDEPLRITNVQTTNYTHNTVLTTLTGSHTLTGGYASVDAALGSRTERFVTTHLDAFDLSVGAAQANELVQGPLSTDLPVVLTCDCNASPASSTYALLTGAGLRDSWLEAHPDQPGYTCCQSPTLLNPRSTLASRIDYIFTRGGGLKAAAVDAVGADLASRSTPSGFWPSDHAGLVASFVQGSVGG